MLSTSETQEQVLRRVEVPVQNDCEQMGPWSDPATPLQPLAPAGAHPPAFLPGSCTASQHLQMSCICLAQSPFKEVLFFLATFLHSCDVGISYSHYSPVIFSPFSHTVLQTPETKITKGDFLGTLWHVCGFTDLKSGYS